MANIYVFLHGRVSPLGGGVFINCVVRGRMTEKGGEREGLEMGSGSMMGEGRGPWT